MRISFRNRVLIGCVLVVVCSLTLVAVYLQPSLRDYLITQIRKGLQSDLILMREVVSDRWSTGRTPAETDELADELGRLLGIRVTLIEPGGKVLGDSELSAEELSYVENHKNRPEVVRALRGEKGGSVRHSSTIGVNFIYVADILGTTEKPLLILRLALPLSDVSESLAHVRNLMAWVFVSGVFLSLITAFLVAYQISRPVRALADISRRMAQGDFSQRIRRYDQHEIGDLGRDFDLMAESIQEKVRTITHARNRLESILRGMVEAVLVTDAAGRIIMVNHALVNLLHLKDDPIGRKPSEIFRNAELIDAIREVRKGEPVRTLEVHTWDQNPRYLDVVVSALPEETEETGVVAVFHDVTERRSIEIMRREFVANVSHELRTPLASIRGSVETLLDGALDNPKYARKFTEVINRQVKRLENIVVDLLDLARLESDQQEPEIHPIKLGEMARSCQAALSELASRKGVALELHLPEPEPVLHGDRRKLEQAVINLMDNAVKYTPAGGSVSLAVREDEDSVQLVVKDTGLGIPAEHLPRLFERFYRVDKSRSRELGGTGLGLAIVKHVAQVHNGRVEVESTPGRGSEFRVIIPRQAEPGSGNRNRPADGAAGE